MLNLCWHIDVDHRIRLLPICQSCRTTKLSFSRNIYLHFLDILIQLSLSYIQQSWIFDAHSLRHYKIVDILFWMKMYPFYTNLGQSFMNQVHPIQENPFLGQDDPNSCWKKCEDDVSGEWKYLGSVYEIETINFWYKDVLHTQFW